MKKWRIMILLSCMAVMLAGCQEKAAEEEQVEFTQIAPKESEPVIIREENVTKTQEASVEEETTQTQTEEEIIPYADKNVVAYKIEDASYEEGVIKVTYPQLTGMENEELQNRINENIRQAVLKGSTEEGLQAFSISYETATAGTGIVSFVFRGSTSYMGAAYSNNIVKTLNIDLTNGKNLRLKEYADVADVVTGLETGEGYTIVSEGIEPADFNAFLNNGYLTDYAITMLDYDVDFEHQDMIPAGYSCIRDNRLVLFIEAEHAMGDYVEIIFAKQLG